MIRRSELDRALEYVRRTSVPDDIEAALRRAPDGGRPRQLRVDVFLAAVMLTALRTRTVHLNEVHKTLTEQLGDNVQRDLGVFDLTLRQVRYLMKAITKAYDYRAKNPHLDPADLAHRKNSLQAILDKLTGAAGAYLPTNGHYAVDATAIDSHAVPRGTAAQINEPRPHAGEAFGVPAPDAAPRTRYLADPDARWGYRTKTWNNRTDRVFGYNVIAFARIRSEDSTSTTPPHLVDRIAVVPANQTGVHETIELIDTFDTNRPVRELVVDRGFSGADMCNFRGPLRERNVDITLDLRSSDHGASPHPDGYLIIDGDPYCPSIPTELRNLHSTEDIKAKKPKKDATPEETAAWQERMMNREQFVQPIERRKAYRLERKGKASNGKGVRYTCPAKVGKIVCEGCPLSMNLQNDDRGLEEIAPPPSYGADNVSAPRKVCNSSVTIPYAVLGKFSQKHTFGTDQWRRSYARRTLVEQTFGHLKGNKGMLKRGWTLQMGEATISLLLGIVFAAYNLATLLRWAKDNSWTADPLTRIVVPVGGIFDPDPGTGASTGAPPPGAGPPGTP